jgi:hypothetical protein
MKTDNHTVDVDNQSLQNVPFNTGVFRAGEDPKVAGSPVKPGMADFASLIYSPFLTTAEHPSRKKHHAC